MPRNSFIQMTKLTNVTGRINYISSYAKQENLYAVYETTDRNFWRELAKCSQEEFRKSGTEGKCIEARELIIALPETFVDYNPETLLRTFTEHFKNSYGTECIAALHHNKRKTNYHIHLIFSERTILETPIEKTASRNMFYDEQGNHVRTKKEILDEQGNIRKGCKIVKKGDVYERNIFSVKDRRFKTDSFLDEVKHNYTELINTHVKDEKQKLRVFERDGLYLATKKIGKNNPKADEIRADNEMRNEWNSTVDRAIVTGIARTDIIQIKRENITEKVSASIRAYGFKPDALTAFIRNAIELLNQLITMVLDKTLELFNMVRRDKIKKAKPRKRPKMSQEAALYNRLCGIREELVAQNNAIFEAERKRGEMETELLDAKGIFRAKRRSEISKEISAMDVRIANMKKRLTDIVKGYGYENAEQFYLALNRAEEACISYKKSLAEWERQQGEAKEMLSDENIEWKSNYVQNRNRESR